MWITRVYRETDDAHRGGGGRVSRTGRKTEGSVSYQLSMAFHAARYRGAESRPVGRPGRVENDQCADDEFHAGPLPGIAVGTGLRRQSDFAERLDAVSGARA